jgi:hypothetical protein
MVRRFRDLAEAEAFLGPALDRPEAASLRAVAPGLTLERRAVEFGGGTFCNRYTARWAAPARAEICVVDPLESPFARAQRLAGRGFRGVVATGGFFFLADDAEVLPRARSLNLAVVGGVAVSMPVVGQTALVGRAGALEVREVAAAGTLRVNGEVLRWVGSRADGGAECVVFGNADARVEHRADARTGKLRHFVPASRWTPALAAGSGAIDVGFRRVEGAFVAMEYAAGGGIDIFKYDLVLRCEDSRVLGVEDRAEILTVDRLELGDPRLTAISVGPSLLDTRLAEHPLHREPSLGSYPLLGGQRAARLLYFRDGEGACHLQLWDGRPGSAVCPGVTLEEVAERVRGEYAVVEGCFLDSGRTGKLCVVDETGVHSLGNRHYLRWPVAGDDAFVWTPDAGRPTASLLVIR